MNTLVLLAQTNSGEQIQKIATDFGVDWPHLVAQIISFSIVCILLQRFAYKPILRALEERRQKIAQGLDDAKKISEELAQTEMQRREILRQADAQAAKLIEEARAAAGRVKEAETQKAIAEAQQIVAKSREATAQDYARMIEELKKEVGRLVVKTTANVTGKILTPEDQRRLSEETARNLAA
ncbi:F0F1 ATP synthase subunit B [Edaphobacter modestus]|uniref:ATP synthase subunit b n=1 Tax=Edaphobacter modestus TaxID=388466 RepID=A0A4Q7YUG9_9BACT|nr:F0F1 ATP synthase subunit B [Edaphobacter modestus]RZU40751.1 F-type H+-transporting ATPase subunit b [Edaphobacter modestus]